ncbi:MAG: response regulator [Phycisphaerae bacterium]|nr:response regulator [Phycisphaerae bacterium]
MAFVAVDTPRILLLSGAQARTASLLSLLDREGEVRVVDSCQEAIEAIQAGEVDIVVSDAGDFLPDQCAQCSRWIRQAIGTSGEGVAAVSLTGKILWGNSSLQAMPEAVLGAIVGTCLSVAGDWQRSAEHGRMASRAVERFTASNERGEQIDYEVAVSPVLDAEAHLTQMAAVVRDITTAVQFQRRIQAVQQAGERLSRLEAEQFIGLEVPQRVAKVEEQIVSCARDLMNFQRFSIRLLDRKTGRLDVAMAQGMSDAVYTREITASAEGQGICGFVAATGRSYICPNTSADPRYLQGIGDAGSSLTAPLWLHDELVGVFNVESDRVNVFDDVDRQMLEVFGRHVAVTLNILDLLVVERFHTTGRFADDVSSEISGPLNDILSEASALVDEYIGDEALHARLQTIVGNVTKIRDSVKQAARPTNGFRGDVSNGKKAPDPALAGKRLLVADDEDAIRETLYEVLRKEGCEVDTARDGAQAVALLAQGDYDLVLADIRMPHKNGYEVFADAKERNPDCPVILMTGFGYDPDHSIVRARQEGLSAVLFKPFKVDELLTAIRQALGQPVNP